jgi:hypothetical protein
MNTYAASFNGSSQYLTVPSTGTNAAFTFAGNFTVEGWYYPTSTTGDHAIFCLGTETTNRYVWYISSGGQISSNLFGAATKSYTVTTIPINTWTHIAIVRTTSTVTVYVNGVASVTTDTQAGTIGNGVVKIGSDSGGTASFAGYISNFRVASIAVYTGAFNPSATALTATQSANTNGNPSAALTGTQTSVLTCQSSTIVDNGVANTGVGFTIANTGTVTTSITTVPGNTFTVNTTPSVALSSASISIANGSMNLIADNRTIPKLSAIARLRSTTIDLIRRANGLLKSIAVLRDIRNTNYVNGSLVRGGTGNIVTAGVSVREFRANVAQATPTDTVSTTDGLLTKQLFILRDTNTVGQVTRSDGVLTKQLFTLRDTSRIDQVTRTDGFMKSISVLRNTSTVDQISRTDGLLIKQLFTLRDASKFNYVNGSLVRGGTGNIVTAGVSVREFRANVAQPTLTDTVSTTDGLLSKQLFILRDTNTVGQVSRTNGLLKNISSLRLPGTDRYVTVGGRLKSIAAIRDVRPTIPTNRIESTAALYSTKPSGAPSTALDRLFYFTAVPGLRYSLSTEQGVRPTPTPFVANANSAIVTTTLSGSLATTPLAITTSGGTYTGISGFTGYCIPAASATSVQPGLILTAAANASGTSVFSNTATVAFVSYVDAAVTPAIYVFFPGTPISAWLNGYSMTLVYPNSTTIGNAVTPSSTIDTYNRFLLAPGMRYSLSTEQGVRPTRSMSSDVLSRTDGLISNVYLQNGFFINAAQIGNVLSIQTAATGFPYQQGGSTIGTVYTQPFGGILKAGKTLYGPGGATATIVNQRFNNPANFDVVLSSGAYSISSGLGTITLPSVAGMYRGSPIRFSLSILNLIAGTTYYVTSIIGTTITISSISPGNSNFVFSSSISGTLSPDPGGLSIYYGTVNQGQPQGYAQDATTSVFASYVVDTNQTVAAGIWFVPSDANFSNRPTNSRDTLNTFLMAPGLRYSKAVQEGEIDFHNNLTSPAAARAVLTNPGLTTYQATNTQAWTSSTYNRLPTAYSITVALLLPLGEVARDIRLVVTADRIEVAYQQSPSTATYVGTISDTVMTLYDTSAGAGSAAVNYSYQWPGSLGGFYRNANTIIDWRIGGGCLEVWIKPTTSGILLCYGTAGSDMGWFLDILSNGSISRSYGGLGNFSIAGTEIIAPAGSITFNAWNHVALVSTGGSGYTTYCMINGVQKGSTANGVPSGVNKSLYIGTYFNNADATNRYFSGYMKDLRLVSGSPVYSTAGFTPPILPLTAISGTTFLSLQNASTTGLTVFTTAPTQSSESPFNNLTFGYYIPSTISTGADVSGVGIVNSPRITGKISSSQYSVSVAQNISAITTFTSTNSGGDYVYTNRPTTPRDSLYTFQMAPGLRYSLSTEQGKLVADTAFKKKPPIQFWN